MMNVSEQFLPLLIGTKNVYLHSSLNDLYLLLVHPLDIYAKFEHFLHFVSTDSGVCICKVKLILHQLRCKSRNMPPVKRCRQQVCPGKRCQRQPSANHICV